MQFPVNDNSAKCPPVCVCVDFLLSVKISLRMDILESQDGSVVGVSWPLSSVLAFEWFR